MMSDSINLDSSDIVGSLDEFESLQTIQAELDILNEQHNDAKVVIAPAHIEMIPNLIPKDELDIKDESRMDEDDDDDDTMDQEIITANMIDDTMSNEMIQNVMEMQDEEAEMQAEHMETVIRHDNHSLFSRGVVEEIIEDDQVIKEDPDTNMYEIQHISQDQILEEKTDYIDFLNDNVITEETIIESGEVEDKTQEKFEMDVLSEQIDPLDTSDADQTMHVEQDNIQHVQNIQNIQNKPTFVQISSSSHVQTPVSVTYVINNLKGQSLLQTGTIMTSKPAPTKMARVVTIPNDGTTATTPTGQTIRIVAPHGKMLGGMGKAFTLEQAKKMGLISQSSINQILPANAKTVTVVKSPAKILPAPPPQNKGPHKVLIRHANSLKPGTISLQSTPGNPLIRIPSNQPITTHLQLPGGTKQVQYVKLIGGNKALLPVSLQKTIPVASLLNSQATYKVVPISAAQTANTNTNTTTTQRVLIPATAAQQQQPVSVTIPQTQNLNSIVVFPSNLIQQPVKKIPPKEDTPNWNQPQQQSGSNSLSPNSANMSPNHKDAKTEYWSGDEIVEANGIRPRKPCNCTKSMCLKLYCDCFANGEFCNMCNCTTCYNNLDHEEERQTAIKACLERNPAAFRPKIGKTFTGSEERRHNKGCNCRRSGCLKNYCECYEAKIPCSKNCKCIGCKNLESYNSKRGPNSEDRIRAKDTIELFNPQYDQHSAGQRQAFNLMSNEVVQATCQCLIAQAEELDKEYSLANVERTQSHIIEEFGRCVVQIIECVAKSISQQPLPSTS